MEGRPLEEVKRKYEGRGVRCFFVDEGECWPTALEFAKHERLTVPVLRDPLWQLPAACRSGCPGAAVLGPAGQVVDVRVFRESGQSRAHLESVLDAQLAGHNTHVGVAPGPPRPALPAALSTAWGAATLVSRPEARSYLPTIAASGDQVYVAWVEDVLANGRVWVRCLTDPAGRPECLTPADADACSPELVADRQGRLWLCWTQRDRGNYGIRVASPADGRWSEATLVSDPGDDCFAPTITGASDGTVVAAWLAWFTQQGAAQQSPGGPYHLRQIEASVYQKGNWSEPGPVGSVGVCEDNWDPALTVDAAGRPLLCWAHDYGNDLCVNWSRLAVGEWSRERLIGKTPRPPGVRGPAGRAWHWAPAVRTPQSGRSLAAWIRRPGSGFGAWTVQAALFNGEQWSEPEGVSGDRPGGKPVVVPLGPEQFGVVWADEPTGRPGGRVWWAARLAGKWTRPEVLVEGTANLNAAAGVDAAGRVWVAWQAGGEGAWGIYAVASERP